MTVGGSAQPADESDAYAWLEYGGDGLPHVRVVPSDRATCPQATADGRGVMLGLRIEAAPGFDRVLCDAALPAGSRTVRLGDRVLPPLPQHITRFAVLGDTGCRIAGDDVQDCRDNRAWPFARIAHAIAALDPRPDLIVHLGDYVYRESPCPAGDARCAGSPYGDEWPAWAVDFFEPGAPLFTTAPVIWVRGSQEDCAHGGLGWSRYLAPNPQPACAAHEATVVLSFGDLRFVDIDSAGGAERIGAAPVPGGDTFVLTNRASLADPAAQAPRDPNGSDIAAVIAGHIRLFAVLPSAGEPPTIIVGNGGDALATGAAEELGTAFGRTAEARFGFAVFDRERGGWSLSERDPDGSEHRRCELRPHAVHCS